MTAWSLLAAVMCIREARQAFVEAGGLRDLEGVLVRVGLAPVITYAAAQSCRQVVGEKTCRQSGTER